MTDAAATVERPAELTAGVSGSGAIVLARVSRFPRTDASGASLAGTILMLLSGTLLFTRLVAIASAR
jgi:hypothetical protein